jgi:hypothetical protein
MGKRTSPIKFEYSRKKRVIILISDKEEVLNRIGHFVDKTQLYKIRLGFAESNFLIQKIDNTLYMSSLEAALASDDIQ